jgi:hypothetical protein
MQALISVVSLTKAFLLKFLRIYPVMRSNLGAFLGLRLVLTSSATNLGVANAHAKIKHFEAACFTLSVPCQMPNV